MGRHRVSRDYTGSALWQPCCWAGVWCDSRLLTAANIRFIAFSKNRWEWRCTENIKYWWFICLFITTINGRHTCGKTPPIFVRGRCLEAFAGGSQPEPSISVSSVCECGVGGMLDAHIFECGVSASEGQSTFQNVSTALTLPINFRIDLKWEIGSVNNRLTLPWRYFIPVGKMLFCCWLLYFSLT